MEQNVFAHVWLQVNVFSVSVWMIMCTFVKQCLCEKDREWLGLCLGVNVCGENECMGAGLCASVLAVNVIVFWLGLSGAPSSGLVEIPATPTSPSLSQFDSWWDLRWNVHVWIASNIHNNLISSLHLVHLFPPSCFHSLLCLLSFYLQSLSCLFLSVFRYTSHTIYRVQEQCLPLHFGL